MFAFYLQEKNGMLRHAFLRVGEDICLLHFVGPQVVSYPPCYFCVALTACLLARACEGCNKGIKCNTKTFTNSCTTSKEVSVRAKMSL